MNFKILLISSYEMGRQPFGLASPAAWLRDAGATVNCLDLAVESLQVELVKTADLIAFYVPMHMATRMAAAALKRVRSLNPEAKICFYGLYAATNTTYFHELGVDYLLSGEFESGLVDLAKHLAAKGQDNNQYPHKNGSSISLNRQQFIRPDRIGLPTPSSYARLVTGAGRPKTVGYVEASRGCKHLCRHCPIVPVYGGKFRIVQKDVVLADIAQQVDAGVEHITFGDPDFFNGPGHAIPLVESLHEAFPHLTYDATIKIEHLLKYQAYLETLKKTGCLFITSAVESFDPKILSIFDKGHTKQEVESVLQSCRELDLLLVPTFVAFTPWTTLAGYRLFLAEIASLELIDLVAPIQYTLRLLIPPGSKLLELSSVKDLIGGLDNSKLNYIWQNPDERVDQIQRELERLVQRNGHLDRRKLFKEIWDRAWQVDGQATERLPVPDRPRERTVIPRLTEPWYC